MYRDVGGLHKILMILMPFQEIRAVEATVQLDFSPPNRIWWGLKQKSGVGKRVQVGLAQKVRPWGPQFVFFFSFANRLS